MCMSLHHSGVVARPPISRPARSPVARCISAAGVRDALERVLAHRAARGEELLQPVLQEVVRAVRLGPERVFRMGLAALLIAYAGMVLVAPFLLIDYANPVVLAGGHALAAALLLYWARTANPRYHTKFTRFYMRVWMLFFLEYLLVPIACLANT